MASLVAIELHDVAPATWPRCAALLRMLDSAGARNLTLLVVPWYRRGVAIDAAPEFVDAVSRRLDRGDEAALHGFVHVDEAPPPRGVRGFVERRVLTRSEGEFAAIEAPDARQRLERAIALWRRTGWPLGGFVPPAWLLGTGARSALVGTPFEYVALRRSLHRLPDWRPVATDMLCYSPTSAPRRAMSRALIALASARASPSRLLRLALHPQDATAGGVVDHWRRIVTDVLGRRDPVTTRTALDVASGASSVKPIDAVSGPLRATR